MIIIFGTKDLAEMSKFYFEQQGKRVLAFVQDEEFIEESIFCGLPVFPFENIEKNYPPENVEFFAPLSGVKMNTVRESIYNKIKAKKYKMPTYIHETAHVWDKDALGENCFIQELNNIQFNTWVGNNVVMWAGNHIGHHGNIGHHVFFTSHVVLSGHCTVGDNCWFGVNSTIKDFTTLKSGTLVAMGAMITKDTESWKFYLGSPARSRGDSMDIEL